MACIIIVFAPYLLSFPFPISSQYNKNYDSDDEYQNRLEIFMNNAIFIENFSKEKHTYECT